MGAHHRRTTPYVPFFARTVVRTHASQQLLKQRFREWAPFDKRVQT